jgi:hypothetical protein
MRLAALLLVAAAAAPGAPAHLEARLQRLLGFSSEDVVGAGKQPVVRELEKESDPRTLSVAGVVWIPASPGRIAERLGRDRGLVKHAALRQSGSFSDPAVPGDLASYHLPKSERSM